MTRPGDRPSAIRPVAIHVAGAILVLGGLYGLSQLLAGDFAITGSLPAKDPIVGVALALDAASVALGVLAWRRRGWLPATSLAGTFAILYLAAMARPANAVLGAAYLVAVVILVLDRRSFEVPARR